jgi:hypothetical protein
MSKPLLFSVSFPTCRGAGAGGPVSARVCGAERAPARQKACVCVTRAITLSANSHHKTRHPHRVRHPHRHASPHLHTYTSTHTHTHLNIYAHPHIPMLTPHRYTHPRTPPHTPYRHTRPALSGRNLANASSVPFDLILQASAGQCGCTATYRAARLLCSRGTPSSSVAIGLARYWTCFTSRSLQER